MKVPIINVKTWANFCPHIFYILLLNLRSHWHIMHIYSLFDGKIWEKSIKRCKDMKELPQNEGSLCQCLLLISLIHEVQTYISVAVWDGTFKMLFTKVHRYKLDLCCRLCICNCLQTLLDMIIRPRVSPCGH